MRASVLALLVASAATRPASAKPPPYYEEDMVDEGYRGTIAIVDAISAGVLGTGIALVATQDGGGRAFGIMATVVGAGAYVWGSPIVHYRHDRMDAFKFDIALRVLVPGLAASIAAGVTSCPDDDSGCDSRLVAISIATGAAIVGVSTIDIAKFARRRVPYVRLAGGATTFGVVGRF